MNYTNIEKQQVLELHQAGKSIRQISSYTNIPKSTVADWIKECNQSTPKEVSGHSPENPDIMSGHPEKPTNFDDPDRFHEKFPENIEKNDPSLVSGPEKLPLERREEFPPPDISRQLEVTKQSPDHVSYSDHTETQKKEQPDNDLILQERKVKLQESSARKKRARIKLQERKYVGNLKSITRYYHRKIEWTIKELLRLQERVAKLKTEMENFYTKYSSMDWGKDGLKYLLDIEDDIDDVLDCDEPIEPFEIHFNKTMKSIFENIKDL